MNPHPWQWEHRVLITGPPGNSPLLPLCPLICISIDLTHLFSPNPSFLLATNPKPLQLLRHCSLSQFPHKTTKVTLSHRNPAPSEHVTLNHCWGEHPPWGLSSPRQEHTLAHQLTCEESAEPQSPGRSGKRHAQAQIPLQPWATSPQNARGGASRQRPVP